MKFKKFNKKEKKKVYSKLQILEHNNLQPNKEKKNKINYILW